MWLLNFYRFYVSLLLGALGYLFILPSLWIGLSIVVLVRTGWYFVERYIRKIRVNAWFVEHQSAFKEKFGPYGIRIINKAETDVSIKYSLAEVFTPNLKKLKENISNLETMDTLFNAGMRPDGDTWQLHDLKLKYGQHRLEKESIR